MASLAVGGTLEACSGGDGSGGSDPTADASAAGGTNTSGSAGQTNSGGGGVNTAGSAGQSSGGGGVNAGGSAGQTSSGGGGVNAGGSAAPDAAVPDASPPDASTSPPPDTGALDVSAGSPDASSNDASSTDGGTEASTCRNAIEDPGEQCCTATDRVAFVGEVAAAFVGEFPMTVCLPTSQVGSPSGTFGTGARWCTSNSGVGCNPGCLLPTAWTNAMATFNGENHTLLATVTISPFYAPINGRILGIASSCTVQVSGTGDLSMMFDVVDHGTYVDGALTNVDGASIDPQALDLTLSIPQGCTLLTDVQGLEAAITESARAAVLEIVHLTFTGLRHDCAY